MNRDLAGRKKKAIESVGQSAQATTFDHTFDLNNLYHRLIKMIYNLAQIYIKRCLE